MNQSQNKGNIFSNNPLPKNGRVIQLDTSKGKTKSAKYPANELGDTIRDFKVIFGFNKTEGGK